MPEKTTLCPLDCPDACSLEMQVTDGRVTAVTGGRANPLTQGYICAKVRHLPDSLYGEHRLGEPLIRVGAKGSGEFHSVSWDTALDLVAEKLRHAREVHGGESILPISYGGSNDLLSQDTTDARLFRRLGAARLARTICAVATGRAAEGLYGKMPGTAFPDYAHAGLIVVWGCNPHATGVHLVPHIQEAQKRGAKLVVVDPRRTKLAHRADLHLAPHPGTDLPLALALLQWMFAHGKADEAFLSAHTRNANSLRRASEPWNLDRAAHTCRVPAPDIEAFAKLYSEIRPAVMRCGWGLERNRNGGSAAAAVLALPAVAGAFGVRGGGYTLSNSAAWGLDSTAAANAAESNTRVFNMNKVGSLLAGEADPPVRVAFVYNANPVSTFPRQDLVRVGLSREDLFTVVFDSFLTDTARYADVILPAAAFPERHLLAMGYGAYVLHRASPATPSFASSRTNHEVFLDLCRRLDLTRPDDPQSEDDAYRAIVGAHPEGERLAAALDTAGIAFPAFGTEPVQFVDVFPNTPDGKIDLFPASLDAESPSGLYAYQPDPGGKQHPLALISPATNQTVSSLLGHADRGQAKLRLHNADAVTRNIKDGDRVRVYNEFGEVRCFVQIDPRVRMGVVELPKGIWDHRTLSGTTSNALVPDTLTDLGGGACFNDARVEVERLADSEV